MLVVEIGPWGSVARETVGPCDLYPHIWAEHRQNAINRSAEPTYGGEEIAMAYIQMTIEEVRSTHAKLTFDQRLPADDEELLGRLEIEMKMLLLEQLNEIVKGIGDLSRLSECIRKEQIQVSAQTWAADRV